MLMKPVAWRNNEASRLPVVALDRLALRPHKGISHATQNNNVSARPVIMRLFVCAYGEFRHVTTKGIFRKLEANLRTASAPFFPVKQLKIPNIGNEVRLPGSSGIPGAGAAEIIFLRVEAIGKSVVTIEEEVRVVKQIHHHRCTRHCQITSGFAAVAVEMLVPGVQRRGKHR